MDLKTIVEQARTRTSRGFCIESAAWDGGRLLPDSGTDKVLYYVTDHLGSTRVVKDGAGSIRQRYDYYPYGSVARSWSSNSSTNSPDKRYRFGGKEIAGSGLSALTGSSIPYLDFGARLYSPGTAIWLSQDPLAEKYYPLTPYMYCAGRPANLVDPEGKSWYYSFVNGSFIAHIDDNDDMIYLLTQEQIDAANGNQELLQSSRADNNMFGQLALEEQLNNSIAYNVIIDLFNRANTKEESGKRQYIVNPRIKVVLDGDLNGEEASSTSKVINVNLKEGYFRGYNVINLFAHEIGHILHRQNNSYKGLSPSEKERVADRFAKHHWSNNKISQRRQDAVIQHARENGYNWYEL